MNGVPAEQAEAVAVAWRMHDWQAHPAIRVGGVLDALSWPARTGVRAASSGCLTRAFS